MGFTCYTYKIWKVNVDIKDILVHFVLTKFQTDNMIK